MKISAKDAVHFATKGKGAFLAALLFGPNPGLVRELADQIALRVLGAPDPSRVSVLAPDAVRKDPSLLAQAVLQGDMFSQAGVRIVRIQDAGDTLAAVFTQFIAEAPADAFAVVEAGELTPKSALRALFESTKTAAAIACYEDTPDVLMALAKDMLGAQKLTAEPGTLRLLVDRAGSDRRLVRAEAQKLILLGGDGSGRIDPEAAAQLLSGEGEADSDMIVSATALGNFKLLDQLLRRAEEGGAASGPFVSAALRHCHALLSVKAAVRYEPELDPAKQRGFWGHSEASVRAQFSLWDERRLREAVHHLGLAEAQTRTTGLPEWPIGGQALLRVCRLAAAKSSPAP